MTDDDARDRVELAGVRELKEVPVDRVRRAADVLEEQDRALQLELPRRRQRLHEELEAAADERRRHLAAANDAEPGIVGVRRHLPGTATAEHLQQPVLREVADVRAADAREAVAVDRRQPRALANRDVQRGDVGEPDERLRVLGDRLEVEVWDRLSRAEPALEHLHDVDLGIREVRIQVGGPLLGASGDVVVALPDSRRELHVVTARLPPLHPA
jgi:hypothetical protein